MITDRARLVRHLAAAFSVLAAWFGGLAALALVLEPTPSVLVLAPRAAAIRAAVQADATLLDVHTVASVARSQRQGFVRDLYAGGAWLVLPAPEGGCLGLYQPASNRPQAGEAKEDLR